MKNQLLFNFMQALFRKMSFRMAAFAVLTLLTAQSSFAQVNYSWTGATNLELSNVGNWAAASVPPTSITSADNYTVTTASGKITNSAAFTCRTLTINQGITVDANANITANTNNTSSVNGTLNIKAGICNFQKCYVGATAGTGNTGVVNVEVGATLTGNNNVWRVGAAASPATGTININGGTMTLTGTGSLSLGYANTGVMNLNSGTATIATTAGFSLTAKGTINVAGGVWNHGPVNISNDGTINVTNGVFKLSNAAATINNSTTAATTAATGVININGTTAKLEASGTLAIGNSFAGSTGLVTVNVNSGTMDVGGALTISAPSGIYTGLINIDAGSIVLTGNQTAGIAALITASRIKTSGAALAAGKIISNTYDAGTNKTTVTAIAASSNTAPVVNNDAIIVAPGGTATALVGGTATSVLTNDTDAEGNTLTATVVTGPANGALTLNSNGTFSYVHNGTATTSDSFTYKANDGTVDSSNTATVTITISSVNNAPVANNDAFSVKQGGTVVTAGATSVLTNDTDAEGNTLTATVVTGPANGTLTLNANGTFSYLHNNSATTTDSFTYKANDGTSDSNEATVNITVTAPVTTTNTWTGGTSTDFLAASNWTASDAPNPAVFSTLASFTVPSTANSPVLNANYSTVSGAASCVALTVSSGAVLTANANIATSSTTTTSLVNGTLHINAGATCNLLRLYTGNSTGTTGTINVSTGGTLSGNSYWRVGAVASCPGIININGGTLVYSGAATGVVLGYAATGSINLYSGTATINGIFDINATGTLNVADGVWNHSTANINNAGTISITGGTFKLLNAAASINAGTTSTTGVINIATGGTLETVTGSSLTIGSTTTGTVNVNVNGGTVNVNGTLSVLPTATVNIDAGSIVLNGNQIGAIDALVGAGRIKTSGAALAAGKILSNTYNAGTDKTTVVAISSTVPNTTWNGSWSNGAPTATTEAIIEGNYATGTNGAFTAKKLTVNSGSLTLNTGTIVTVQNEVINNAGAGGIVVENNANLVQVNNTTNTGNITVNRNSSPLLRLDYTLWSSPVAGQNLAAFSPLTSQSPNRFYTYDTANNQYSNAFDPTTTNFAAGTGYLIRMPNTADAVTPTAYAGQFTGVPNNGDVPFTLSTAGNAYNLVGNPYPSTINLFTLQSNNSTVIGTTFYMWRTTNAAGTAYCTYVPTSTSAGTYVSNGNAQSPVSFVGNIQPGQGFFVKALTTGPLVFKNGQRATTASSFFKTKQVAASDKVWLNATNAAGDFSQMAVTYFDGATPDVDAFDGKYINDSPLALTSNINNEEYTIQGRPAFDAADVVSLNFKTAVAGDYTIVIDHSEGVFTAGQSVILTDATTGTETDLTTAAYTFTAATGTANSRFSLKYQKTLGTNKAVFNDNNVTVYKSKGTLYVNAGDAIIANIKVYDVQGKLVAEIKNGKATSATIANLKATNQVLVVKITSQDNKVVTKKVVN